MSEMMTFVRNLSFDGSVLIPFTIGTLLLVAVLCLNLCFRNFRKGMTPEQRKREDKDLTNFMAKY